MNFIDESNKKTLGHRNEFLQSKIIIKDTALLELSKLYPFYGYVDIEIEGVEPFIMFSNNDDVVARSYFWKGSDAYESMSLKVWASFAKNSPVILDIGAYTGVYSLVASRKNLKAKVFAFEALDRVYSRLLINKQVNKLGNLQTFNYAVSDNENEVEFNVYSGESILVTGSSLIDKTVNRDIYERKKVKSIILDEFLKGFQLGGVQLIKIDAEGAENLVLKGAKEIIKRDCPDILIELLKNADLKTILEIISCHPYNFYRINDFSEKIEPLSTLKVATGMHNLNTLISCKSEDEIQSILSLGKL
jgi:FkbM family methyltransferase